MPTLPLFDRSAEPGAWHAVQSPGGYECWTFDAEDPTTDTQLTILFTTGTPQDAVYLRRYVQYKRQPTTTAPPLPRDHAGVLIRVYRDGQVLHQSYRTGRLEIDGTAMTIGDARLTRSADAWQFTASNIELAFKSDGVPATSLRSVLRFFRKSQHHWTLLVPRCTVSGNWSALGEKVGVFSGVGSVEYAFGTAPICYGVARLIRGRVLTAERAAVFHIAQHALQRSEQEALLLSISPDGAMESVSARIDRPYARTIAFANQLTLSNPRVVHADAFSQRIVFDAELEGKPGTAHCDAFYPRPPRRPIRTACFEWLMSAD